MKKIIIILSLMLIIICGITTLTVFASDMSSHFPIDSFDESPGTTVAGTEAVKKLVNNSAITLITGARIVCVTIAVVMLLVIAMKYMISSPGDRADIKKHAVNYVVGAVVLFGVTGILTIIDNFASLFGQK